ncbi:SDR family oxidoreductase [Anaeromyxobacter sp. Fw109-5]|uniref:SDR family oxidoreductase n=1 Tax=Anaeromyxobacter sp. (strain Fw109-5) TaxID=404589 RepID=UPI000674E84E|nr:SDR family oxidoreductase [Anaeromyxobacter sp. Fw109-5]
MSELAGQTVAIVGASSGIGLATAKAAAAQGATTVLLSRSQARLDEAARAVPGTTRAVAMDMLDEAAVGRAMSAVGAIDHLVLTAVGDEYEFSGPIAELTAEQLERSLDKLRGYVTVTRAAVPRIRERGSITLLSGAGAARPPKGTSFPAAANGAIVSFGRALALELAPLRVNVVMPGLVDTPLHGEKRAALAAWAESPALPARRFGQADDIAHAIVFLMTNRYVTGHTLVVDGGLLAG